MKQIFVINDYTELNEVTYCTKRIKEYLDANCVPHKDIIAMLTQNSGSFDSCGLFKKILGLSKVYYYTDNPAYYIYHDIQHTQYQVIILLLSRNVAAQVLKALMHVPAFTVKTKSIELLKLHTLDFCEYLGEI